MKSTKKIICLCFMLAVVCAALLALTVGAADDITSGICGSNVTWEFDAETGTLTVSGNGRMYDYYYTTRPWNDYIAQIKNVVVEDGVTTVSDGAFRNHTALETVKLGNAVGSIGEKSFYSCSALTGIEIPEGVTVIDDNAFAYCEKMTSVSLPSTLETIGEYSFRNCNGITVIDLPKGLTSIGKYAFYFCAKLESISVPGGVKTIYNSTFSNCPSLADVTLNNGIEVIEQFAFNGCSSLKEIDIPDSVTTLGNSVFSGAGLEKIVLSDNITSLGSAIFNGCKSLVSVDLPDNVTAIGNHMFNRCEKLVSIDIPYTVTSIGDYAFERCCSLKNVHIPIKVKTIGTWAFSECEELIGVTVAGDIESMGEKAFYQCKKLKSVVFSGKVTNIGNYAFNYCGALETVAFSKETINIGEGAFQGCTLLGSIKLTGTESIGSSAFGSCENLDKITVTSSLKSIGSWAFMACRKLNTIIYCGTAEEWETGVEIGTSWNYNSPVSVSFHDYNNGICAVCGVWDEVTPIIRGAGVTLNENLTIKYYALIPMANAGAQMRFTMNDKSSVVDGVYDAQSGYYVFDFERIAPQCMGDNIKAELLFEGEVIALKDGYSIIQNCVNLMTKNPTNLKLTDLIKNLLNYGAAAQIYREYKVDTLVNQGYEIDPVTPDESASIKDLTNNTGDVKFKAGGVRFANVNKIYVDVYSSEKPTVTVNGVVGEAVQTADGEWRIYSDDIKVTEFDDAYTFVITSSTNADKPTFVYSVNSYAYAKQSSSNPNMKDLATATYAYGVAAENYIK